MSLVFSLANELREKLDQIYKENSRAEVVVHCHERPTVFAAALVGEDYPIKIIQTLHAPFAEQYDISDSTAGDSYIRQFARIVEAGLTLKPDHLIAVDTLQKQIVEDKVCDKKLKIKEIINSVDINIPVLEENYIHKTYGIDKYIVVARHLYKKNGVEYAIKAFSMVNEKSHALFIIGEGTEKENLQNLISELGLEKRVFLIGRQPHETSLNIIAHAKLSLVPSVPIGIYIEAASLTMLESMLLGTPVVASNIGGLKQVIENRKTGILVKEADAQSLATAIDNMLEDDMLYDSISRNAKELVLNNYNTTRWFQKISEIYENLG